MALRKGPTIHGRGSAMGGIGSIPLVAGPVFAVQGADVIGFFVVFFFLVIIVLIFVFETIKVVKEDERIVNFRLGKAQAEKGPGIVIIIPGIDKPVRVDLRERFLMIPHQTCITQDNAPVDVDFMVYIKGASLRAEWARQAEILAAEGYAQALTTVFGAARGIDEKTLMIQYLDTLKTLGTSAATKFILPMEFTELIRPFRNVISTAEGGSARDGDK